MEEAQSIQTCLDVLSKHIKDVYITKETSDCEFLVGEEAVPFRGHKFLMAAYSPVFKEMFYSNRPQPEPIRINDMFPDAFIAVLNFIYLNRVEIKSPKHGAQVLRAARRFMIHELTDACTGYVTSADATSSTFDLFEIANVEGLTAACLANAVTDPAFLTSERFLKAHITVVRMIVERDDLNIQSEVEVLKAVERWAIERAASRGITLEQMLPEMDGVVGQIRFKTMRTAELTSEVENSPLLSHEEKIALVMSQAQSGIVPYPRRFSTSVRVRSIDPARAQWKLVRRWNNRRPMEVSIPDVHLLPLKYFTVSRPILLTGLRINKDRYMDVTVTNSLENYQKWSVEKAGVHGKFSFDQPISLYPAERYWLIVNRSVQQGCDVPAMVDYFDDVCTTYRLHNMTVTMSEDFSQVSELYFKEH